MSWRLLAAPARHWHSSPVKPLQEDSCQPSPSPTAQPIQPHPRRRLRWLATAVAAAIVIIAQAFLSVLPASAATPSVEAGVNLRPCVSLSNGNCAPVGVTDGGTLYKMRCWRDGTSVTGNYTSQRWLLVSLRNGQEGYVHSSYVTNQVGTPSCSTLPYVRAADFAISLIGQTYASSTVAGDYTAGDWAPGPYGEWSGDCAKLTGSSFTRGAGVGYRRGNAIDQYNGYRNDGKIYGGIPRYGDPVFYNIAAPYGHTAIYIGGLTIVSTQGMDHANLPIAKRGLYSFSSYLGWAAI